MVLGYTLKVDLMGFAEVLDLESAIKHPRDAKVFGLIIWEDGATTS